MHHSTERILVTHVGSLPRSDALLGLLGQVEAGQEVDRAAFRARCLRACGLSSATRRKRASTSPETVNCRASASRFTRRTG